MPTKRKDKIEYHFPVLTYTPYYFSSKGLKSYEEDLLSAQKLTLQGKYSDSILICNLLAKVELPDHIRFGLYYDYFFNFYFLGQYTDTVKYLSLMEEFLKEEHEYLEDLKLIYASCKFILTNDANLVLRINIEKLSAEALNFYQSISMESSIYNSNLETPSALRAYTVYAQMMELKGCMPMALSAHAILGMLYDKSRNTKMKFEHIKKACQIAYDENLLSLLAQYLILRPKEFRNFVNQYEMEFNQKAFELSKRNYLSYRLILNLASTEEKNREEKALENELLFLLSYEFTNSEIMSIKKISLTDLNSRMNMLKQKLGYTTKNELTEYAKKRFEQ